MGFRVQREFLPALSTCATTNSILRTATAVYRLIIARYRGARSCSSAFQRWPATSTRKTPSSKRSARVRSATADPQTTGHAKSGPSAGGASRKDFATIFSSPDPADSKLQRLGSACATTLLRDHDFSILVARQAAGPQHTRPEIRDAQIQAPCRARAIALPAEHLPPPPESRET